MNMFYHTFEIIAVDCQHNYMIYNGIIILVSYRTYGEHMTLRICFKSACKLLNLRASSFSPQKKVQCVGKIFCVEYEISQKYLTHTLKDAIVIKRLNFQSS